MPDAATFSVLIVDDYPITRFGVRSLLNAQEDVNVLADTTLGSDALSMVREHHPDVVIMSTNMNWASSVDFVKQARAGSPQTKIVVFANGAKEEDPLAIISAGADGYLLKNAPCNNVTAAIRTVLSGAPWLDPQIAKHVLFRYPDRAGNGNGEHRRPSLTNREREILTLIVNGSSNVEIASHLAISRVTVKSHITHILAKLGVSDRTKAAVKAIREGLL